MLFIPGTIISILTFPGVIVHELGHKWACDLLGVPVHKTCYFRFGNPAGYVEHEIPKRFSHIFLIVIGPLLLNTFMAAVLMFFTRDVIIGDFRGFAWIMVWLGFSVAMHAFPSDGDAKVLWHESKIHVKDNPLAMIGFPVSALIWTASKLRIIWFDLIYAFIIAYGIGILRGPL